MTMKRPALAAAILLAAFAAQAQIYQWQDENNKTVISDRPPSGPVRQLRRIDTEAPPPASEPAAAPAKTLADREMEFRKRQKEAREAAEKSRQGTAREREKAEDCEAAVAAAAASSPANASRPARQPRASATILDDSAARAGAITRTRACDRRHCQ
jgi:hypothetical protein